MSDPVTLVVPADARYRTLAPELAGKYVEIAGGSAADAKTLSEAVLRALTTLTAAGADIDVAFHSEGSRVEITLRCGGRSAVVKHLLRAAKG